MKKIEGLLKRMLSILLDSEEKWFPGREIIVVMYWDKNNFFVFSFVRHQG